MEELCSAVLEVRCIKWLHSVIMNLLYRLGKRHLQFCVLRSFLQVVETSLIALFSCYGNGNKVISTVTVTVHNSERLRTTVSCM